MHPPPPPHLLGQEGCEGISARNHIFQITHVASNYSCGLSAGRETEVMNTASPPPPPNPPSAATLSERVSVLRHA